MDFDLERGGRQCSYEDRKTVSPGLQILELEIASFVRAHAACLPLISELNRNSSSRPARAVAYDSRPGNGALAEKRGGGQGDEKSDSNFASRVDRARQTQEFGPRGFLGSVNVRGKNFVENLDRKS